MIGAKTLKRANALAIFALLAGIAALMVAGTLIVDFMLGVIINQLAPQDWTQEVWIRGATCLALSTIVATLLIALGVNHFRRNSSDQ